MKKRPLNHAKDLRVLVAGYSHGLRSSYAFLTAPHLPLISRAVSVLADIARDRDHRAFAGSSRNKTWRTEI